MWSYYSTPLFGFKEMGSFFHGSAKVDITRIMPTEKITKQELNQLRILFYKWKSNANYDESLCDVGDWIVNALFKACGPKSEDRWIELFNKIQGDTRLDDETCEEMAYEKLVLEREKKGVESGS